MRRGWAACAALTVLAIIPTSASATTLTGPSPLTYTASAGDNDVMSVAVNGTAVVFSPTADNKKAWTYPGNCSQDGNFVVTCTSASAIPIVFNVGDDDDSVDASGLTATLTFNGAAGADTFTGGPNNDTVDGGDGGDTLSGGAGIDTIAGGNDNDTVAGGDGNDPLDGGAGDDTVRGQNNDDLIQGGTGSDLLDGGPGTNTLQGGAASDTLKGGGGIDSLDGGADRDLLSGGLGADGIVGGGGFDEVDYDDRGSASPGVTVTLDDAANDGEAGEADNVHSDVEDMLGGGGPDHLFGNDAANLIAGGGGNDEIDGGAGFDNLSGDDGDDALRARDGNAERVDCGAGNDSALVDPVDQPTGCETATIDADADGVSPPSDCADTAAAVHPGAVDVPDNGVDEDCDGADATNGDRDADGSARPADCDDGNAAVHPGAAEAPGNAVDENCDGIAAPFPLAATDLALAAHVTGKSTRFSALALAEVAAGAKVTMRCKGPGCPRALAHGFAETVKKGSKRLNLLPELHNAALHPGAKLTVSAAAGGFTAVTFEIRPRKGSAPQVARRCQPPGDRKASEC